MAVRFNDLKPRQQLAILIGVPAVVAIALGVLIYRAMGELGPDEDDRLPRFLHRELPVSKWATINEKKVQIAEKDKIIAEKPAVELELANLEVAIKAGLDRLPLESEKAEMRLLIEKLARDIPSDTGTVQVQSVRIVEDAVSAGSRSGGAAPQRVTYLTEITGDLNGIIKYIDMIEKNPRFMLVNSFTIKPGGMAMDAEKKVVFQPHSVQMSLITYVYNPAKSGGGR